MSSLRFVPKSERLIVAKKEAQEQAQADLFDPEKAKQDRHSKARQILVHQVLQESKQTEERQQQKLTNAKNDPFNPLSVDDTDGLDPETELLEWELRHLERQKRDKERAERLVQEKAEVERTRNMTPEERAILDSQKQAEWEAKEQDKSAPMFLQKYYHKGAFYQDDPNMTPLLQRDYNQPTFLDKQAKDTLPSVMQVKDWGKRSRSKWKHLTAEDTTSFDYGWGAKDHRANYVNISKMGGLHDKLKRGKK